MLAQTELAAKRVGRLLVDGGGIIGRQRRGDLAYRSAADICAVKLVKLGLGRYRSKDEAAKRRKQTV
jgi:hypothetical protein